MFLRKKKNKSGSISIQVISKSSGTYKVEHSFGASKDPKILQQLEQEALSWIQKKTKQKELDFTNESNIANQVLEGISELKSVGISLLITPIFNQIGFNKIEDDLFRLLVLSRLENPLSKLATSQYYALTQSLNIDENKIYRYLDKLYREQKETIQYISYEHTRGVLGGNVSIAFYDVTTLYFETDNQDKLRKTGFSKEGKHQHPQIILGLLVSKNGYPLAYEIFEGNKFEGHTMLPLIEEFCKKYNIPQMVVVADSGLMSKNNIKELIDNKYLFILGARLKQYTKKIKDQILALTLTNGETSVIELEDKQKLIISYSDKRAKKDSHNRELGLERLRKKVKTGKLTKSNINNRGYNKYLKMEGDVSLSIDMDKYEQDAKWDGLKGYITNTQLTNDQVIENYQELWKIEKAFRISKSNLKIRPIYHRLERRIKAHICISFVAYKIFKELERQLDEMKASISVEKAINIAKTIHAIRVKMPNNMIIEKTLILHEDQKELAQLFNFRVSQ